MPETRAHRSVVDARERGFSKGIAAAIVVAVLGAGVVGFFALTGPGSAGAGGNPIDEVDETPPDLIALGNEGQGMSIQLTDKDDPNRLAGLIEAASFEPVGPNERLVEEPRAWVFFKDGRSAYVEAAHGRFLMPSPNAAPESGMLRGRVGEPVRLRLFEARADGQRPDPQVVPAALTATFDEPLQFDFRHARISTTGAFDITSPELSFSGSYLTAVINQVRERLEVLEVRRGDALVFTPMTDEERAELRAAQGVATADEQESERVGTEDPLTRIDDVASAEPPAEAPKAVVANTRPSATAPESAAGNAAAVATIADEIASAIEHYRVVMLDDVVVTQGTRTLKADRLDLWARLIDNQLAPRAIAPLAFTQASNDVTETVADRDERAVGARRSPTATASTVSAQQPQTPAPTQEPTSESIVLNWSGSMLVTPLGDEVPPELGEEEIALRFTSERSGFVAFEDPDAGASGRSASLDYGLSTGLLVLGSPGGTGTLRVDGAGELVSGRVEADLIDGVVTIPGPGQLAASQEASADRDDGGRATLTWERRAQFVFVTDDEGRVVGGLDRATLWGGVRGAQGDARFGAETLIATFTPPQPDKQQRLDMIDLAFGEATDGKGAELRGDAVVVEFTDGTSGNDTDVRRVTARGSAVAARPGESLSADFLTATLSRRYEGKLAVDHVSASGGLVFTGKDGLLAHADAMRGDGVSQVITLDGAPASVRQRSSQLEGDRIIIDGRQRRARVPGPGAFAHDPDADTQQSGQPREISRDTAPILASWQREMTFDDTTGRIDCLGGATVVSRAREHTTDTLLAERLVVEITPFVDDASSEGTSNPERTLLRVTAIGGVGNDGSVTRASAESRVFDSTQPDRVLQLFYLEGEEVFADVENNRLTVPTAGKLLVLDRRDRESDANQAEFGQDGPGLSRFVWQDRMTFDRGTGTTVMRGGVDAASKDLATGRTAILRCQRLAAKFQELDAAGNPVDPTAPGGDAVRGKLTLAEAFNAVYFASGDGREMAADRLLYDALRGVATATALPGRAVTVLDTTRGSTTTSEALVWNMVTDRVEVVRPSPVVAPR